MFFSRFWSKEPSGLSTEAQYRKELSGILVDVGVQLIQLAKS